MLKNCAASLHPVLPKWKCGVHHIVRTLGRRSTQQRCVSIPLTTPRVMSYPIFHLTWTPSLETGRWFQMWSSTKSQLVKTPIIRWCVSFICLKAKLGGLLYRISNSQGAKPPRDPVLGTYHCSKRLGLAAWRAFQYPYCRLYDFERQSIETRSLYSPLLTLWVERQFENSFPLLP